MFDTSHSFPVPIPRFQVPAMPTSRTTSTPSTTGDREAREQILHAARVLWSHGHGVYTGPVVTVANPEDSGQELVVRPNAAADGLQVAGQQSPAALRPDATPDQLLGILFSRDEVRILAEMLGDRPVKAVHVLDATRIEKSKFYVLWSNLQQRGIVNDADEGEGFVIAMGWVKEYIAAKVAAMSPAPARPGDVV